MNSAKYFHELGAQIERAFRAIDWDESRFPDLALEALERNPAHRNVRPVDVLSEVAEGAALPAQAADRSTFGEPPLTVFARTSFVIDVYFWFDGSTSTHEHSFCGAFQVLGGSSLHAIRRFECKRRVNSRFLLGDVRTERCEVLDVGDTRRILPGRAFAHALFHLDSPSTTVVIRTRGNPDAMPQYTYAPPHIAFDPFFKPRSRELQLEALHALERFDRERYWAALDAALEQSTLDEAFPLLRAHAAHCLAATGSLEGDEFQGRIVACAKRHPTADVDILVRCLHEECRVIDLVRCREHARGIEERFVLATLLNSHNRAQVVDFMRVRYPTEKPADAFMRGFAALVKVPEGGGEPPLGLELGEDAMTVCRLLLEGVAVEDLPRRLLETRPVAVTEKHRAEIDRFLKQLLAIPALGVLAR
jgi:hypothetical protein